MSHFSNIQYEIWDGTTSKVMCVTQSKTLLLQAKGTGTYTVMAQIVPETDFAPIMVIGLHDLKTKSEVTDTNIYTADLTGIYAITVTATGFDSITASATL